MLILYPNTCFSSIKGIVNIINYFASLTKTLEIIKHLSFFLTDFLGSCTTSKRHKEGSEGEGECREVSLFHR